jgi:hypothetical protein
MDNANIPYNYETWHHCITVDCKIDITKKFVEERISALQNTKDFRTRQFVQLYGDQHRKDVLGWLQQSLQS